MVIDSVLNAIFNFLFKTAAKIAEFFYLQHYLKQMF